jgi:ATP-dependent Clp protease ATP-binding subunit ClpA
VLQEITKAQGQIILFIDEDVRLIQRLLNC